MGRASSLPATAVPTGVTAFQTAVELSHWPNCGIEPDARTEPDGYHELHHGRATHDECCDKHRCEYGDDGKSRLDGGAAVDESDASGHPRANRRPEPRIRRRTADVASGAGRHQYRRERRRRPYKHA